MTDKFKVGQKVRIIYPALDPLVGIITFIKKAREKRNVKNISNGKISELFVYELEYYYNDAFVGLPENMLIPIYDDESNIKTNWDESIWKPKIKEEIN